MKTLLAFSTSLLLIGAVVVPQTARADSADASCEVSKNGDKWHGVSGPCTFSQRQGSIDLRFKNGATYSLRPSGNANHYRDEHGNKVVRNYSGGNSQEFKWEGGKKVVVNLYGSAYDNRNGYHDGHAQSYNNNYNNNNYNSGGYGTGNNGSRSSEYQRGYNDAQRGAYDQDRHNQDYKDGYRAGEQGGGDGHSNSGRNSGDGEYYINRLQNGGFEVVWSTHGCVGTFTRDGEPLGYSNSCTNSQTQRSRDIAKRQR